MFPSCSTGHSLQSLLSAKCSWSQNREGQRANASAVARAAEDHVADAHCQSLTLIAGDLTDQW